MSNGGRGPGFLTSTLISLVALAAAIWVAAAVVPGVHVFGGVGTYLWIALLFAVVNTVVGSILRLVTFPLIVLTLGLASFAVTVAMFALTARLSSKLDIDGVGSAIIASLVVAVVSGLLGSLTRRALT